MTNISKPTKPTQNKPGRKRKYHTEEERKEARRLQNKAYRERKQKALIEMRRAQNALDRSNNVSIEQSERENESEKQNSS